VEVLEVDAGRDIVNKAEEVRNAAVAVVTGVAQCKACRGT
jgi:hypothetical protein